MAGKKRKKKYKHLGLLDRDRIEALLKSGHKQKEIAEVLGINKSTISREIKRNRRKIRTVGGNKDGPYEASVADHKAYVNRLYSKYQGKKINENIDLQNYIIEKLEKHWNPDEISGRMKEEKKPFYASKTAIYEWLYSAWGQKHCHLLYSKQYHSKKQKKKKTERTLIPNRKSITERPLGAINRTRFGHYEADTIVSGKKTGSRESLSVIYERKAKYIDAKKIQNLKPETNVIAIKEMEEKLSKVLSATFDNGIENTRHEKLGFNTYFCDPYSSWQKGGVENANKMIRRYIPKGSDISKYSNSYVKMVVERINDKPRKSLNYKTASEVMIQNNLIKTNKKAPNILGQKVALRG